MKGNVWKSNEMVAMYFILPSFIGFLMFTGIPIIASLGLSFFSWNMLQPAEFVGFDNFVNMLSNDPIFLKVLSNTVLFVIGSVPFSIGLGLAIALLLNQKIKFVAFFRAAYFLPVITSVVAVSLVWTWIFSPNYGFLNEFLMRIGISDPPTWLSSTTWALPAIIIVAIWKNIGFNMVIYLAGLQDIPKDLYESADLDGASRWQKIRHVTMPLLRPTTFFVTIMAIINSFQVFGFALMMTEGGPGTATNTLVLYIYQQGFNYFNMGYASAMAWFLFIIIFSFTLLQTVYSKRKGGF